MRLIRNLRHRILAMLSNSRITMKGLTVFNAIAEYKTTQAAALKLNITQSAASQALAKLEQTLNTSLFDRNGRQLIINENGRLLLSLAMNVLSAVNDIESLFLAQQISIKIGASTTIGNYMMPSKIVQFREQYPLSKLDMMVDNTRAIIDAVANFEIDIGLIEGECHHNEILITEWQHDELVLFASNTTSNHHMNLTQLNEQLWLLREKGSGTRAIVERFLNTHLNNFHLDMELGNSEAIKHAVSAGLGISYLSRCVIDDLLTQQKICLIDSPLPKLMRKFYIITHRNKQHTQGMNAFLALIDMRRHS